MKTITYSEQGTYTITKAVEFGDEEIKELIAANALVVNDLTGELEVNDSKELWQAFNVDSGECQTDVDFAEFEIVITGEGQ